MADQFQSLVMAILDDDRARVNELLDKDAPLATATAKTARLESKIPHWIYAGDTALHVAAAGYRVEIAKLLLAAGADVGAATNHRSSQPLHYASDGYLESAHWDAKRQVQMIELLLKAGADIHAQDKNGATPLHRAVRTRCAAAVKCLLNAGSDATLKTSLARHPFILLSKTRDVVEAARKKRSQHNVKSSRRFLNEGSVHVSGTQTASLFWNGPGANGFNKS